MSACISASILSNYSVDTPPPIKYLVLAGGSHIYRVSISIVYPTVTDNNIMSAIQHHTVYI